MKYSVYFVLTATIINAVHISGATDSWTQKDKDILHNRQLVSKAQHTEADAAAASRGAGGSKRAEANRAAQRAFGSLSVKVNRERRLKNYEPVSVSVDP